ncbi:MAG: alpha/beta fold hydrolase [Verrucomicrobiota bacterium]
MNSGDAMKDLLGRCVLTAGCLLGLNGSVQVANGEIKQEGTLSGDRWIAPDGANFPFTVWMPENKAGLEAVFVAVHGLSGAADDFRPLGNFFRRRGVAVYASELRGQGNDPEQRRRGDIRSVEWWYRDLDAFVGHVRRAHPEVPVFLFGESMGALIVLHGLDDMEEGNVAAVAGIVFSSPVVGYRERVPLFVRLLVNVVGTIVPRWKVSFEALAGDEGAAAVKVTSDTTHSGQMAKTDHYVSHFTLRLLRAVDRLVRSAAGAAKKLEHPVFLIHAGNDVFTSTEQVEQFYEGIPSRDKAKFFSRESFHLILHDKDGENALAALERWMGGRMPARK